MRQTKLCAMSMLHLLDNFENVDHKHLDFFHFRLQERKVVSKRRMASSGFTIAKPSSTNDKRPDLVMAPMILTSSTPHACVGHSSGKSGSPCAVAAALVVQSESSSSVHQALMKEVQRGRVVKKMLLVIQQVLESQILAKSNLKKNRVNAAQLASGMFPALVFEYLSLRTAEHDVLLPHVSVFPSGRPRSVAKRLTPHVHDILRVTGDVLTRLCNEIAETILSDVSHLSEEMKTTEIVTTGELVVVTELDNCVTLSFCEFTHTLLRSHREKLRKLFLGSKKHDFDVYVFILLQRYFSLTGCAPNPDAEGGWHGAVPPHVIEGMVNLFGVSVECFASPFNTSCPSYCSAFPDVDCFFGSIGSFFDCRFLEGTFEANPPFEHATVMGMADCIVKSLATSTRPLAFLIVLPWSDKQKTLMSLATFYTAVSPFVSASIELTAASTPFVDGYQQCSLNSAFTSRLNTKLTLVQNDAHKQTLQDAQPLLEQLAKLWHLDAKRPRE